MFATIIKDRIQMEDAFRNINHGIALRIKAKKRAQARVAQARKMAEPFNSIRVTALCLFAGPHQR